MDIKIGMYFKGIMNGKVIKIVNVSNQAVTYAALDTGIVFTMGRKAFEHLYLERV